MLSPLAQSQIQILFRLKRPVMSINAERLWRKPIGRSIYANSATAGRTNYIPLIITAVYVFHIKINFKISLANGLFRCVSTTPQDPGVLNCDLGLYFLCPWLSLPRNQQLFSPTSVFMAFASPLGTHRVSV